MPFNPYESPKEECGRRQVRVNVQTETVHRLWLTALFAISLALAAGSVGGICGAIHWQITNPQRAPSDYRIIYEVVKIIAFVACAALFTRKSVWLYTILR